MSATSEYELLSTLRRYKAKAETTLFFVVLFNTTALFITSFSLISFSFNMRFTRKVNPIKKLVCVLTTLLFYSILLITRTKKVYFLYEERIKKLLLLNERSTSASKNYLRRVLTVDIDTVTFEGKSLSSLRSFNQTFFCGQKTLVSGEVGSGKSTLLNIIAGIIPNIIDCEFCGSVLIDGYPVQGNEIDYVFQHSENSMFFDTVECQLGHIDATKRAYWLERFGIEDLCSKAISDLSIGQKKMVSIMSCLLAESAICLLDEPTAHLDQEALTVFIELLNSVVEQKIIIVVSHEQSIRESFDQIICLNSVAICSDNFYEELSAPRRIYKTPIIHVRNLTYSYPDGTIALQDISLSISGGEIIGLVGANGSGKSTLSMLIAENAVSQLTNEAIIFSRKCSVALMLQDADIQFFTTRVASEVTFGNSITANSERVNQLLELFGLLEYLEQPPQFLSEGQKKCLLITCMLLSEPDILILDEPFDSLDTKMRQVLKTVLCQYMSWTNGEKAIVINDQTDYDIRQIATQSIFLPSRNRKGGQ